MPSTLTINDSVLIDLLLYELNKGNDLIFKQNVAIIWQYYSNKSNIYPTLRYMYVKRHAISFLIGQSVLLYDIEQDGVTEKQRQIFDNLVRYYNLTQAEIELEEKRNNVTFDILVGDPLVAVLIPYKNLTWFNPNDLRYGGLPIIPGLESYVTL